MFVDVYIEGASTSYTIPVNEITITETLDETLDSATITLPIGTDKEPYKPDSKVTIRTYSDSSYSNIEYKYFVLVSDTVKVVGKGSTTRYQHELTVAQYSRVLSKHIVRNSVFTQPAKNLHKVEYNTSYFWNEVPNPDKWDKISELSTSTTTMYKEKVKSAKIVIKAEAVDSTFKLITAPTLDSVALVVKQDGTTIYGEAVTITSGKKEITLSTSIFANDGETHTYTLEFAWLGYSSGSELDHNTYKNVVVHYNLEFETYYYTLYDVLVLLKDREQLKYKNDGNQDIYRSIDFTIPNSGEFYNVLSSTIAPNFAFTQKNMYECVAEVLNYLDGVPTLSSTKELGIEYLNDNDTSNVISDNDIIAVESDIAEEKYANKLVSLFQNAVPDNSKYFPSLNGYTSPKSTSFGVPSESEWVYELPEPIEEIISIELIPSFCYEFSLSNKIGTEVNVPIDITDYCLEKSEWDLLNTSWTLPSATNTKVKNNTIYYTKRGNNITIGTINDNNLNKYYNYNYAIRYAILKYFGMSIADNVNTTFTSFEQSKDIAVRIKYKPCINGRLDVQTPSYKYEGEIIVDQSNGEVDLKKLGQNMLGLSARIGEPTKTISTNVFHDFKDRPKKGSIYTDSNGDKWFANIVKTTLYPNCCLSEIQLSKNFNRLSQFVNINQVKRFYEISSDLTQTSESFLTEYLFFEAYKTTPTLPTTYKCSFNKSLLMHFMTNIGSYQPGLSSVNPIQFAIGNFAYGGSNGTNSSCGTSNLMLGLVPYGAGNSLVYQMSFTHPKMGGKSTNYSGSINTKALYYTTDNGFFDTTTINIGGFNNVTDKGDYFKNAPDMSATNVLSTMDKFITLKNVRVFKQPNEIFKINYQLTLMSLNVNQVFFGEKLINKNWLVGGDKALASNRIYTSTTYRYSIIDKKCVGTILTSGTVLSNYGSSTNNPTMTGYVSTDGHSEYSLTENIVSWAIGDSEGNILLAFNIDLKTGDNLKFSCYGDYKR